MERRLRVIQLFNGRPVVKGPTNEPLAIHPELEDFRFEIKTIYPKPWPWNPFAKMHNAYCGLDPLRALLVLLRERKADLICAHLESAALVLLLRRLFRFNVPVVIWEVPWSPGWRYREWLTRLTVPRADCCIVFGRNQSQLIHDQFGERVRTAFVPFYVDTQFFRPQPASGAHSGFVWSCGLDVGRDFTLLLEVSKTVPAAFRIKSGNPLHISVETHPNVIEESEYLPAVTFRERYADAAVVVVSTKSTPNASGVTSLLEALAMGRPTIVSDNPALRDYIPPKGAAIVVPVGDGEALKRAIVFLLENPSAAEAMGRSARLFAETNLSRHVHFAAAADVFGDTIALYEKSGA